MFYGTCCNIIDTLIIDQDEIIINYHESLGSVLGDRFSYRCKSSDLTNEQFDAICRYKSFMTIEPKSNPTRYVNVIPAQRNMDAVFSHITNHPSHRIAFQETRTDVIVNDDGIERAARLMLVTIVHECTHLSDGQNYKRFDQNRSNDDQEERRAYGNEKKYVPTLSELNWAKTQIKMMIAKMK